MKNISDKVVVYSGIVLEIIILIISIFMLNSNVKDASDVIQSIVAVINLVIVIIFFIISDINNNNEIKNKNKQYWYKNYIVSEFLPIFDSFFLSTKEKIEMISKRKYKNDEQKENEFEACLQDFSDKLQEIIQGSYLKIRVISIELANKIQNEMQDIEDKYSEKMEIIIFCVGQTRETALKELIQLTLNKQAYMFKIFYDYGKKIDYIK